MTTETNAQAPASTDPLAAMLAQVPADSPMASEIRALMDERQKAIEAAMAKYTKKTEALAEKAQDNALRESLAAIAEGERESYKGIFEELGITIPASGIVLMRKITIKPDAAGKPLVSIENLEKVKPVGVTGTGTRKPRGTGTASGWSLNAANVPGFKGYVLPNGEETASAASVLKHFDAFKAGDSQARVIARWAADNAEKAATVQVVFDNGTKRNLSEVVAEHVKTAVAEAPVAEAPVAPPIPS